VRVPLVKNQECQNLLRENTRLGPFFELDDSFLCAGGQKGVDTCKGDGGSPLVCEQSGGDFVQVGFCDKNWIELLKSFSNRKAGIVSWGIGCGGVGTPAIYTHVAKAACWIDSQVSLLENSVSSKTRFF
jgi:secreted trypsin-like serine protease